MQNALSHIVLILCLLSLFSCKSGTAGNAAPPQPVSELDWSERGDKITLTSINSDFAAGHQSANEFADKIGARLKTAYANGKPVKVVSPQVDVALFLVSEHQYALEIRWSCRLVPARPEEADYMFDRRGTLGQGATAEDARQNTQNELKSSNKVENELVKPFSGKFKQFRTSVESGITGSADERKFVYIEETFAMIGKERKTAQANVNAASNTNSAANTKATNK